MKTLDRINDYSALLDRQAAYQSLIKLRNKNAGKSSRSSAGSYDIMVCGGTGCVSSDSILIAKNLSALVKEKKLSSKVRVIQTGCFGFCERGPVVVIQPDDVFYTRVTPADAAQIIETHIIKGVKVDRLLYKDPSSGESLEKSADIPFYKKQKRIALRNCGLIDPENIMEYIACGGYQALGKSLTEGSPESIIEVLKKSGLRGRGGGGFPTGLKWELARKGAGLSKASGVQEKFVLCNADEGDPGAFMDRSIMEGDPCSVIEAMTIAGYVIGAPQGYVYIRAEYPLAVHRLKTAIKQSEDCGLLGENILGSGFSFNIALKLGAGAFVCGEETALIHSVEGERGEPTTKPPYPAISGLWSKPTLVNNVETYANIPPIIMNGPDWYSSIGFEKSRGTKVFALAGKINNVGLVEIPMGTSLREILYDIGGGIKDNKEFKSVQTGGPSGGCLTKENLDIPITYENLQAVGSMMGSGGMIVMDETDCMVNIARFYLEFTLDESCGKCTPCRVGNKRLHEMLTAITKGKAEENTMEKLENLAQIIKKTSLCGLGQSSPNPVLSTLRYFREEYIEHIRDHKCRAGTCKDLLSYHIVKEKCVGCTLCARNCPALCISGKVKAPHEIDQEKCVKCGVCFDRCKFGAILKR